MANIDINNLEDFNTVNAYFMSQVILKKGNSAVAKDEEPKYQI